jgi:glucose-1-phosphate adenylyltransferase
MVRSRSAGGVLAVVLAGGEGRRLLPLTRDRSKPAVPFAGRYRVIDFVLSNLVNSGVDRIYVLTQYKAQSLIEHLQRAWIRMQGRDSFLVAVPAQMQTGASWYCGTANAVHQNLHLLRRCPAEVVAVFGADHIYKMNVEQMVDFHHSRKAAVTVAALAVPVEEATSFGVIEVDDKGRIVGFQEKPANPRPIPGNESHALVSMGNYLFDPEVLEHALLHDADDEGSDNDFGRDVLPYLLDRVPMFAYDFRRNRIPSEREFERAYWRDIGSIEAYYDANMDLRRVQPRLNLYNWDWPIHTASFADPPAKFVFDEANRRGMAVDSILAGGTIVAGGYVRDSVIGRNVFVDAGARVVESIIQDNVTIAPGAEIVRAIVDKNAQIPAGARITPEHDPVVPGSIVTGTGITVVPRATHPPEHTAAREH